MSQPNPSLYRESDPLLAFFEEAPAPGPIESAEPIQRVETPENTQDPPAVQASEADPEWRRRLERAERQIDRALIDISTVKSDLATLVSAVDDIRKRMSRAPAQTAPVVTTPVRTLSGSRAFAAIVILLTAGAVFWGLMSAAPYDAPEPPAVEKETSSAVESPAAIEPPPAPAPVVVPASATGVEEARSATPPPAPARAAPAPPQARAAPARPPSAGYVGTLTVDAEPAGDVYLNRKSVGRTPVRLESLRAGSHLIWIEREGYRRWTRVVAVAADRTSRVSVSLEPLSR